MSLVNAAQTPSEEALVFDCDGAKLLGVLHHGSPDADFAVVTIVAGGPQYRGGVGRQLVTLGRRLAAEGIPVFRFDHRGMGDSAGAFRGFEDMQGDLEAALAALLTRRPGIRRVLLWGGCDAASAALINAHCLPQVVAIAVANPWITDDRMADRVQRQHFLRRLGEGSFWKKVFTLQYNPLDYARGAMAKLRRKAESSPSQASASAAPPQSFVVRMRQGLESFDGELFLLMSGRSLISRQFDQLLASDARWQRAIEDKLVERHIVEGADQTFSGVAARDEMLATLIRWAQQVRDKGSA